MTTIQKDSVINVDGYGKMTVADFLGEWTEKLCPICVEVARRSNDIRETLLLKYYGIGSYLAAELHAIENSGDSTYGLNFYGRIETLTGVQERTLRDCVRVAEVFSHADLLKIQQMPHVTWSHVRAIAVLAVGQNANKWITRTVRDKLTVDDLTQAIKLAAEKKGRRPCDSQDSEPDTPSAASAGRSPAVPTDLNSALRRLHTTVTKFSNDHHVLFEEFNLLDAISDTAPDELTPVLRDQLAGCLEKVVMLEQAWPKMHAQLSESLARVDKTMAEQAKCELQIANVGDDY